MHGKNRFPIYFTDIYDAGYMGNFYGIIAACGGGGAGISVGISHACALIRFIQKKIPLGIRLSLTGTKNQEKDQVTPYSALATALAATIGTGNIVGISTAIAIGGPGAVFWCWLTGVFGIATCYAECYLSIRYRVRRADNTFAGGPMYISASEKKKTGSGVCCMYAAGIVWYRKQRTVILHTHGAPASDYRVAASGRNGGRGACRDYYHRGKQPDCKGVYVARPADERFLCGRLSLYYRKKQGGAAGDVSADSLIRRLPEGCGGRLHRRSAASWHPDRSLPGIVYQ